MEPVALRENPGGGEEGPVNQGADSVVLARFGWSRCCAR